MNVGKFHVDEINNPHKKKEGLEKSSPSFYYKRGRLNFLYNAWEDYRVGGIAQDKTKRSIDYEI